MSTRDSPYFSRVIISLTLMWSRRIAQIREVKYNIIAKYRGEPGPVHRLESSTSFLLRRSSSASSAILAISIWSTLDMSSVQRVSSVVSCAPTRVWKYQLSVCGSGGMEEAYLEVLPISVNLNCELLKVLHRLLDVLGDSLHLIIVYPPRIGAVLLQQFEIRQSWHGMMMGKYRRWLIQVRENVPKTLVLELCVGISQRSLPRLQAEWLRSRTYARSW